VLVGAEIKVASGVSVWFRPLFSVSVIWIFADHKVRQRIAAMDSLRRKASDIGKLDECLGKALNWWSQTQIMLSSMESQAVLSDDLRLSTIRIDMARRSWEAVRRDYMEYKTSVSDIPSV
jgi:hypothetical protein